MHNSFLSQNALIDIESNQVHDNLVPSSVVTIVFFIPFLRGGGVVLSNLKPAHVGWISMLSDLDEASKIEPTKGRP